MGRTWNSPDMRILLFLLYHSRYKKSRINLDDCSTVCQLSAPCRRGSSWAWAVPAHERRAACNQQRYPEFPAAK